jgi:hypothetical protein
VVVRGHARETTDPARIAALDELPLVAWTAREQRHYVSVTLSHLIGRQVSVFSLRSRWWTENP